LQRGDDGEGKFLSFFKKRIQNLKLIHRIRFK
jgi:hypothetical protein